MSDDQIARILAAIDRLSGEMGGLRTEMGELRTDMGGLRAEMGELRTEMGGQRADMSRLRAEVDRMRADMMERMDRLQNAFSLLRDDVGSISVPGNASRGWFTAHPPRPGPSPCRSPPWSGRS